MNVVASGAFECSDVKAGQARCDPCQHRHRFALRTWWSVKRVHDVVPYIRRERNTLITGRCRDGPVMGIVFHVRAPTYWSIQITSRKSSVRSWWSILLTSRNFLISLCDEFNLRSERYTCTACCRCARMTVVVAQSSLGMSDEQTQTGDGVKARPQHENSRPTGQSGCY